MTFQLHHLAALFYFPLYQQICLSFFAPTLMSSVFFVFTLTVSGRGLFYCSPR